MRPEISEGYMSEANKFRIWSKKYKMFTSDPRWPNNQRAHEEFVLTPAGEVWCLVTTDNENYFRDVSDKYVVQRATGLKDVNDKEIYEGDIINHWWTSKEYQQTGIVSSHFGEFIVVSRETFKQAEYIDNIEFTGNMWYQTKLDGLFKSHPKQQAEIIGNILENPKLK